MLRYLEAVSALIGKLGVRPIDSWVREDEWRAGMPGQQFDDLRDECLREEVVMRQPGGRCRICRELEVDHEGADHAFTADTESFQINSMELVRAVSKELARLEPVSLSDPRPQPDTATFQSTGTWIGESQFSMLFHFGRDTPGLPRTDAGLPVVQVNFLGAPPLPEPPAVAVSWHELLDEKDVRARVHAFILSVSDRSYYALADIASDLGGSATEPADALGRFLEKCGFTLVREGYASPADGFEDQARLGPTMRRRFRRHATDLLVECSCKARPGWHVHGYRDRRRTQPLTVEPRLADFATRAAKTSGQYRDLSAQKGRLPTTDTDLPKDVGAVIASVAGAGAVVAGEQWKQYVATSAAGPIEIGATALSLAAGLFVAIPRVRRAYYEWRVSALKWPDHPR